MLDDVRDMMALMALCEEYGEEGVSLEYRFVVPDGQIVHEFEVTETLNGECLFRVDSKCVGEVLNEVNSFISHLPVCEKCAKVLFDNELTMIEGGLEVCPDCMERAKGDYATRQCDLYHEQKEEAL